MYKMVIVDDESMALEQLRDFFVWDLLGLEIAGTFDSSINALKFIQKNKIDILLTDISMPILNGLDLAKECQKKYPNLKIIFFSGYRDFDYLKQAMKLMAVEYLTKPICAEAPDQIVDLDLRHPSLLRKFGHPFIHFTYRRR